MKFLNSIGKKILLNVLLSLVVVAILVFMSLSFFGKIDQIHGINASAFVYEVNVKDVALLFDEFIRTGDKKNIEKALQVLKGISAADGRAGAVYNLLKQGKSVDEAIDIYTQQEAGASKEVTAQTHGYRTGHADDQYDK